MTPRRNDTGRPPLPAADPHLSPHTGYTRAHWEALADRLLGTLPRYASPGLAQYRLPGRTGSAGAWSDGVEGYARSFLLAAFRIAGADGRDTPGSTTIADLIERYAAGLVAGTDPRRRDHWPAITDRSQPMVEAASVAVALHETRPWIWDRLADAERQRVADWLGGFLGASPHDSNWRLFQVIAEEFLASVGAEHDRAEIDAGLARLEDWYRGDGWYTDGDGRKFDYYNAWALHLYPLLWARIAGPRADAGQVADYRDRLRRFLDGHQYFFGADGAPVHQGRSLTYRFASTVPLWMGVLADATPLSAGLTRRLASGALRHFTERGVPGADGVLSLGWYRPFLPVTQPYSGPASPYWASKAFLGLLLPAEHPVWTATEQPGPVETADRVVALPAPGWLLHTTAADGIVRLVNHGTDHLPPPPAPSRSDPHYTRLGYSTATAPETPPAGEPDGPDNHLALLLSPHGASLRGRIHPVRVEGNRAASWHTPVTPVNFKQARVATTSVVHGPWEVRVHRVEAPTGTTMREGGWAVAADTEPPAAESGTGRAVARLESGLTSALVALHGWDAGSTCQGSVSRARDHNAVGRHSATPTLTAVHPGGVLRLATLVLLTADPAVRDDADRLGAAAGAEPTADGGLTIRFPDGATEQVPDGEAVR